MTLTGFVLLYIAATIAIGVIAATRVKNTSDFARRPQPSVAYGHYGNFCDMVRLRNDSWASWTLH